MNLHFDFLEDFANSNNITNKVYLKDMDTYIYGTDSNIKSFLDFFDKNFFSFLFTQQVIFVFDKDKYFLYKQINNDLLNKSINSAFNLLGEILHEKKDS